jgi:hypothetical protein
MIRSISLSLMNLGEEHGFLIWVCGISVENVRVVLVAVAPGTTTDNGSSRIVS